MSTAQRMQRAGRGSRQLQGSTRPVTTGARRRRTAVADDRSVGRAAALVNAGPPVGSNGKDNGHGDGNSYGNGHTDPVARKRLFLEQACRLINADRGVCVVVYMDAVTGRRTVVSVVHVILAPKPSSSNHRARPHTNGSSNGQNGQGGANGNGPAMPPAPPAWHDSPDAETIRRAIGLEHAVESVLPLRGGHVAAWVSVGRPTGRRFTPRQHALLEALHARCADLYAADLRLVAPDVLALTGQQRQCLQYLLAGETERGVARRLRLSHNTVHHHIKGIYRSLGVSTRGGLLARWVGTDGNGSGEHTGIATELTGVKRPA